jgi:predicted kinase
MTTLWVTMGVPGSGKSTFARAHHAARVNPDTIRRILSTWDDQEVNDLVFNLVYGLIEQHLADGTDVIYDGTSLDAQTRADLIKIARKHDCATVLIVFDVDEGLVREQNVRRVNVVPEEVIDRFIDKFDHQLSLTSDEGWNYSIKVDY